MKRACALLSLSGSLLMAACGNTTPAPATSARAAKPYANLAQVMRGIPLRSSNLVFDAPSTDPAVTVPLKKDASEGDKTNALYGGWRSIEDAALAVSETANLLIIPGRACENGKPAPVDAEDFRKFAQQLADAGLAAYKAAQSKNMDNVTDASGAMTEACAACHDVYRERPEGDKTPRCVALAKQPGA
jgi:Cytochrome C'